MLQFTQSPPCPQVVLPPTARWLELLPISRRSLKLETFSLLQVGKMTSLHILCINSHNQYQNLLFEIIFSLSSFQRSVLVLANARRSFQLFEKTPPLVLRLCKVVVIVNMAVMMLLVVLTEKNDINRKPKGSTASTIVIVITITMIMLTNPCSNVRRVLTQTRLRSHTVTQSSHPHSHPVTLSTSEFLVLHSPTFPNSNESA